MANEYSTFQSILTSVLDKHAPRKTKLIRGNSKSYMSKILLKEMWKRARLKNIANRSGNLCDVLNFRRQRNYVCSISKKEKKVTFHHFCFKKTKSRFLGCL